MDFSVIENSEQVAADPDSTQRISGDNTMLLSMSEPAEPERLMLYRSVMQETSRKITSSLSKEELVEMFKDIPSFHKKYNLISYYYDVLSKHIHDQMNSRIEEHIQSAELRDKFTELEDLIKSKSSNETIAWRPSPDVESNLRSYIMREKMKYRDQLNELVSAKEGVVQRLKFDVISSRNQMKKIDERLFAANEKFSSIAKNVEVACKQYYIN